MELHCDRAAILPIRNDSSRRVVRCVMGLSKGCFMKNSTSTIGRINSTAFACKNLRISQQEEENHVGQALLRSIFSSMVAAALFIPAPAYAQDKIYGFPKSDVDEVSNVQKTLVNAWGIVKETYVDPTFNKQDWDSKLQETMDEVLTVKTADAAYSEIRNMLSTLEDPFTRIITPQEFKNFRISNDGAVDGVGVLIASEENTGRLVVISTLENGPAERSGVLIGDELVQVDDEVVTGINGEEAASKLRGAAGTTVNVKLRRKAGDVNSEIKELKLKRETILLSPVYSAVLPHQTQDGHTANIGYIRLSSFSQNAADDMRKAIAKLEDKDASSYILDLRNNPGGLVRAGLDVAEMWLDGNEILVNTIDRRGITYPINLAAGHALTRDPLVVLVNEGSASASEILAGALHDNGRAVILGEKTYGKGKIQSVSELEDGSALFVTVAKYLSPNLHQIDQVGIIPDVQCNPTAAAAAATAAVSSVDTPQAFIERDVCVVAAERLF